MNVPQVHGNSSLLMRELIDLASGEGLCGKEKLWTARYLPGLEAFGTNDSGEVWKGPNSASSSAREKGPMYRPAANSLLTVELYTLGRVLTD